MRQHAMERSSLKAVGPFCAADGSMPLPVHVVIGNAGAELCWNVAPKTPNHFEVCFRAACCKLSCCTPTVGNDHADSAHGCCCCTVLDDQLSDVTTSVMDLLAASVVSRWWSWRGAI